MYDIKSRRPHTTLGVSGKRFEPFNYHNASNNPPTAIIGVNKAGAVMAGCASPVLILVALATPVATPAVTILQEVLVAPFIVTGVGLTALVTAYLDPAARTLLV
jgi:hypothetical protein